MRATLHMIAVCGVLGLAGGLPAAIANADPTVATQIQSQTQSSGAALATVFHAVTGEPLPDMPILVRQVVEPEGTIVVGVFKTGADGQAVIGPLENGLYVAQVIYNNNQSREVLFEINGDIDFYTIITLYFNPDIDPG
jgi:hypothetical protein